MPELSAMQWFIYGGIIALALLAWYQRAVTLAGAATGVFVAAGLYYSAGHTGLVLLAVFFVSGTLVTRYRGKEKQKFSSGTPEKNGRNATQVLANSGAALLCALGLLVVPEQKDAWILGMGAAFAAATADTWSSELGMIWGKRMFRPFGNSNARAGDNGVISFEGTIAGILGNLFIALVFHWLAFPAYSLLLIAGTIGNLADTWLGEFAENKGRLGNNAVNFLSTLIASLLALLIHMF